MDDWIGLAVAGFPELPWPDKTPDRIDVACDLALAIIDAHERGDTAFLQRGYHFVRWTIHHTEDQAVRDSMADYFFNWLLGSKIAKRACLDFLDWGDVQLLTDWTTEPSFDDTENFGKLCGEWKRRWSKNQKLPVPKQPLVE